MFDATVTQICIYMPQHADGGLPGASGETAVSQPIVKTVSYWPQ